MPTPANGSTARSGELGKAVVDDQLVARITKWNLENVVGESAWGDSDSEGWTNRKAARKDCTGSLEGKFDDDDPVYDLFDTGDIVELVLWETASDYWLLERALMRNYKVTYDQDSKEVVGWTSDFGADGKVWRPGQQGIPARTLP